VFAVADGYVSRIKISTLAMEKQFTLIIQWVYFCLWHLKTAEGAINVH
jgi:hypothetical protein